MLAHCRGHGRFDRPVMSIIGRVLAARYRFSLCLGRLGCGFFRSPWMFAAVGEASALAVAAVVVTAVEVGARSPRSPLRPFHSRMWPLSFCATLASLALHMVYAFSPRSAARTNDSSTFVVSRTPRL